MRKRYNENDIKNIKGITFLNKNNEFIFTGYGKPLAADEKTMPDYSILEKYWCINQAINDKPTWEDCGVKYKKDPKMKYSSNISSLFPSSFSFQHTYFPPTFLTDCLPLAMLGALPMNIAIGVTKSANTKVKVPSVKEIIYKIILKMRNFIDSIRERGLLVHVPNDYFES